MISITGNATAITLPKGGVLPAVPLVTVDGQPAPIPFAVSLGGILGLTLIGVTLNGQSTSVIDFGTAWQANSTMKVTLSIENGVSQKTDFSNT